MPVIPQSSTLSILLLYMDFFYNNNSNIGLSILTKRAQDIL